MNRRRHRRRVVAAWFFALAAGFAVAALGTPAGAVETPTGSKNFSAPRYVPNYFSNESGAFTGAPGARGVQPAAPVYATPPAYSRSSRGYAAASRHAGHYRRHTASRGRYHHLARGRAGGRRHFVHVAASGHRHASHAQPAAAHQRAARSHARSSAGNRHFARR